VTYNNEQKDMCEVSMEYLQWLWRWTLNTKFACKTLTWVCKSKRGIIQSKIVATVMGHGK